MIYTDLTKKALRISFEAHKNQTDKSGMPYVFHPFHLAEQMDDEYSTCVALLHDVVEDSDITLNDLIEQGFPQEVTDAIALMTHDKSVPYLEYVAEIRWNPIARKVKLADLHHNSDLSRLDVVDDKAMERVEKYHKAIRILNPLEELIITAGIGSVLRNITLTKTAVNYYYTSIPDIRFDFPDGFFDVKEIKITADDYNKLVERMIGLGLYDIPEYVNPIILNGCIMNRLSYELYDGNEFHWMDYKTPPDEFQRISFLLDYYCDHQKILTDEEMTELLSPKRNFKTDRIIKGWHLSCCQTNVPDTYRFCPQCGKKIENAEKCEFEYDIEETIFLCGHCGSSVPFDEKYCGYCGYKRG